MGFLDYSNATHSNIIPQEEFESLTLEVFSVITQNLSKSLGPLGASATILDGMMTEATKDGYAILKKYRFHNRYKRMIYNLIMAPCTRLNNTVGDATTTVICLTNALFGRYQIVKSDIDTLYRLPRQFTRAWESVISDLTDYVSKHSTPINPEDWDTIYDIAYVVSNGNEEISKAIADTYVEAKSPAIRQKDSPTNKSYIAAVNGFDFPANLISDAFVSNEDLSTNEKSIAIIIMDHKLETDVFNNVIVPLNDVMRARGQKLLILAPYYDAYMVNTHCEKYLMMERQRYGNFNLMLAQFELGKLSPHQMTDLATVLGCKCINQDMMKELMEYMGSGVVADEVVDKILEIPEDKYYGLIGHADEAMLTCQNGSIFKVNDVANNEHYQEVLRAAKAELEAVRKTIDFEKQNYAAKIYEANTRVLQLEMKNYIYYVGADSALQKQIIWDSIEDVIKCVRSAIKYGVVPGCQLTLIQGCNTLISDIIGCASTSQEAKKIIEQLDQSTRLKVDIINIIREAVKDVYSVVLHGGDGMGMIKLMPRWNTTTEEGIEDLKREARAKATQIIDESTEKMQVFDLETLEYSPKIITSAETDIRALEAASELVKILISGNQCIFLDADVNESHQEEVQAFV